MMTKITKQTIMISEIHPIAILQQQQLCLAPQHAVNKQQCFSKQPFFLLSSSLLCSFYDVLLRELKELELSEEELELCSFFLTFLVFFPPSNYYDSSSILSLSNSDFRSSS